MSDDCKLCHGSGEIDITGSGVYGCPLCISSELNGELATFREKCEKFEKHNRTLSDEALKLSALNQKTYALLETREAELLTLQRERDEAAKQEPVAWMWPAFANHDAIVTAKKENTDGWPPVFTLQLYRYPPNLPALIEQAKAEEREAALKPLRTAVMALASAAENNPMYQSAYEELDAAIRARSEK